MLIKHLSVGARVVMGTNPALPSERRADAPIVWMKVNADCDFLCLSHIGTAVYDAAEPSSTNKEKRVRGNPYFPQSNIFIWLNSDSEDWFCKTHKADEKTDIRGTIMDKGFLSVFNQHERKHMIPRRYTVVTPKGCKKQFGAHQEVESLVALPSVSELGLPVDLMEGEKFDTSAVLRLPLNSRLWTRSTTANSVATMNAATQHFLSVAPNSYMSVQPVIRLNPESEVEPDERWFHTYGFNPFLSDDGEFSLNKLLSFQ